MCVFSRVKKTKTTRKRKSIVGNITIARLKQIGIENKKNIVVAMKVIEFMKVVKIQLRKVQMKVKKIKKIIRCKKQLCVWKRLLLKCARIQKNPVT